MTRKVPKDKWKRFFDEVSKSRYQWMVNVEVIRNDIGDQYLDLGLPLNGITAEVRSDRSTIEISVGTTPDQIQSHSIANPQGVAYMSNADDAGGTIEILESDSTKTLIQILRPSPLSIDYSNDREIAAA